MTGDRREPSSGELYRAAQKGAASAAEHGMGGAFDWYAFLKRWGTADEIGKHREAVADLARWWASRGPHGPDTTEHLSGLLDRLQTLHRTAIRAEAGLAALGLNPATARVQGEEAGRGAPRALKTLAILSVAERFKGREYRHPRGKKRVAAIRAALAHAFPPEELTDDVIRSVLDRGR